MPFLDARIPRLVLTQLLKRSPFDLRGLLRVPKTQNPKAIALFLSSLLVLERASVSGHQADIEQLIGCLTALRSSGTEYWCWGYSFPWQTRSILVPSGAPNLIATTFAANALFDAYEQGHGSHCLAAASSAAEYVENELYWSDGSVAGFSYPLPSVRNQVHNANFLAAALLCRAYCHSKEKSFLFPALRVARYSASRQQADGSWSYGEASSQGWIDNFHTGYNLCALQSISRYGGTTEFDSILRRGFEFYRRQFFRESGAVRYFHDRDYPIDIHCVAQSVLTLVALKDLAPGSLSLAHTVLEWALNHMWDDRGFFFYRVLRSCTVRTSYMRWSQAWMLMAAAALLEATLGSVGKAEARA
ncbi:hypothetical protein [Paludibaculum fermentans]|uniref:hypothetical protein n=1 Tax=Paludibaculum fermentans TaxID=1473598 RepID=UPI003EBA0A8D